MYHADCKIDIIVCKAGNPYMLSTEFCLEWIFIYPNDCDHVTTASINSALAAPAITTAITSTTTTTTTTIITTSTTTSDY